MKTDQITIRRLFLGNANAYVVISGNEAAIIDGGLGSRPQRFVDALSAGEGEIRVRYIAVTHAHYDHVGSIRALKQKFPDAAIVAHQIEADNLREGASPVPRGTMWFSRPVSWLGCWLFHNCIRFAGIAVDLEIGDRLECRLGGSELEFFHTPGHTSGSLCVRVGREAVFVGDSVFHVLPGCFFPPFADQPDLIVASWQRIAATGVRMLYPGHGRPVLLKKFVAGNGRFNQPTW
ncbi:MAG: hypothetical protein GQF41_2057 [Candidatus Rifleibacterium amylolyticum]|nr:MAG: hypothetical protein GQF41_2057 [Candidatus Rifleibacterium amylolyticum]